MTNHQERLALLRKMDVDARFMAYCMTNRNRTDSKKIFVPEYKCWVSVPMRPGNSKLDRSILIYDQLAIDTCPIHALCRDTCYAMKAQRMYLEVLLKRTVNTYIAQHNLALMASMLSDQLKHSTKKVVRIHSSGDFFAQDYIDMWTEIARSHPDVRFYTYTKTLDIFDFSAFTALPNTNIVHSLLHDGSLNYGSMEYVMAKAKEYHAPICAYRRGMPKDKIPHCGATCKACIERPYVLFVQH